MLVKNRKYFSASVISDRDMDKLKPQQPLLLLTKAIQILDMWAAETTDFPREVAEHALAHQLPDTVERAYQRGSQFAKRAALMAQWGLFCATAPADAEGTPIPVTT